MVITKTPPKGIENLISEISKRCGVSAAFSKLLVLRGINSADEAEKFIKPDKKNLYNPFLFTGMKETVARIEEAKSNGETVVVYGDYDADGISATTIMYRGLISYGVETYAVVPERENGYGLTAGVLERILEEYCPDLIITVDCGISAYSEIEELKDLGVDVIVTDHHEIPEQIPDCTVINCKLEGYPFDGLCGAGVAYKVIRALTGETADKYLDLVAVATIADSMPLTDENRILVSEGLKLIKSGRGAKVIRALAEVGGMKETGAQSLAYSIAPRINAAGRMGDAYSALAAFTSDDNFEVKILADKLNSYNVARQTECDELYKSAKTLLKDKSPFSRVIILSDESWKPGIIGIVAAKLMEEYRKPAILFTEQGEVLHGSARSFGEINIYKALSSAKDILEGFGGHSQAAGVTIKRENLGKLEEKLNEYIAENYGAEIFSGDIEVDGFITGKFGIELARELDLLEPCGVGNRRPVFAIDINEAYASPIKFGSPHISFTTPKIDLIYFNGYDDLSVLNSASEKVIVFEPKISVYNGRESLKGYVKNVFPIVNDGEAVKQSLFENQLKNEKENGNYEIIDNNAAREFIREAEKEIYGTLFVLSDPETAKNFPELKNTEKQLLKPCARGNLNVLCYGLSSGDYGEYERVVFLDKPLFVPYTDTKTYVNTEINGFNFDSSHADRDELIAIYLKFKKLTDGFSSVKEACVKTGETYAEKVIFALKVFEEIGLIEKRGGKYLVVSGKKCDLNASVIFNRVKSR